MKSKNEESLAKSKALEPIDQLLEMREDYSFTKNIIQINRAVIMAHEEHISFQHDLAQATFMLDLFNDCLMRRMEEKYQIIRK